MKRYIITLRPAPNDHKIGRAQLSSALDKMGVAHKINEFWHYGRYKAEIEIHPSSVSKIEKSGLTESICAA